MIRRRPTPPPHPTGFTLIELLVVIVILGILIGLLVPAVMRAVVTAKEAAVSAEIQGMTQALSAFKNAYGDFPPSRIIVSETGKYDVATLGGAASPFARLAPRTIQAFRRFWPRMDLRTDGSAPNIPGGFYDVNGNGNLDAQPYMLSGPECLVFFLGGIPLQVGGGAGAGNSGWAMTGFSKNPANPMQDSTKGTNRTTPIHEFSSSRLITYPAVFNGGNGAPGGFPAFLDSLGSYDPNDGAIPVYCYFSAYGGVGYDPSDCDMGESDSATGQAMVGAFVSNNAPAAAGSVVAFPGGIQSPAPNPYTNGPPVPTLATGNVNTTPIRPRAWQNANTYQIISAGRDRVFGIGGQYIQAGNVKLPFVDATGGYQTDTFQTMQANAQVTGVTLGKDARAREADNLTNFSQGKLD